MLQLSWQEGLGPDPDGEAEKGNALGNWLSEASESLMFLAENAGEEYFSFARAYDGQDGPLV